MIVNVLGALACLTLTFYFTVFASWRESRAVRRREMARYRIHSDARRVESWWKWGMWWYFWWSTLTPEQVSKCEMWRA